MLGRLLKRLQMEVRASTDCNDFGSIFHRRTQRLFTQFEQALVELGVPNDQTPAPLLASRLTRSQLRPVGSLRHAQLHPPF